MENYDWVLDMELVEELWDDTADYLRDKYWEEFAEVTMDIILQKIEQWEID